LAVRAPSRLHLGLLNLGHGPRRYGGVGLMTDGPGLVVQMDPAESLVCTGPYADRVHQFATVWGGGPDGGRTPGCHLHVVSAPPAHHGLGVGTQLALSVAAGLDEFFGYPCRSVEELALSVGRVGRSSIGTLGFAHGGLLLELGRGPGQTVAPLERRVVPPPAWRVVILRADRTAGLSGAEEQRVLEQLPPVSEHHTQQMLRLAVDQMFPAAQAGDFASFAAAVGEYGRCAGACFHSWQHGTFSDPAQGELATELNRMGLTGVAQSSWGPTILAVVESPDHADWVVRQLRGKPSCTSVNMIVTTINTSGHQLEHVG